MMCTASGALDGGAAAVPPERTEDKMVQEPCVNARLAHGDRLPFERPDYCPP